MLTVAQFIAFFTFIVAVVYLFWQLFIRREFFNPMICVIYGTFHWLLVGQIGHLFFNQVYYEPRDGVFLDSAHLVASFCILATVISVILSYHFVIPRKIHFLPWTDRIETVKLSKITLTFGIIGLYFSLNHLVSFSVEQASFDYALYVLPVTLLLPATSVLGLFLILRAQSKSLLILLCAVFPFATLMTSNIMVIFTLFVLISLLISMHGKVKKVSKLVVLVLLLLMPVIFTFHLIVKVFQRNDDLTVKLSLAKFISEDTINEALFRLSSMDVFNAEGYELLVAVTERFLMEGELKWGASYLAVFFPFLRFISDDIRGYGRMLAIDEGFQDVNVAFNAHPILELFANFGPFFPVLVYVILGVILAKLYCWFARSSNELNGLFYFTILGWLLLIQRGDGVVALLYGGYCIFVIYLIIRLAKTKRSRVFELHTVSN